MVADGDACPFQPLLDGDARKERVGGDDDGQPLLACRADDGRCRGSLLRREPEAAEFLLIEGLEKWFQLVALARKES